MQLTGQQQPAEYSAGGLRMKEGSCVAGLLCREWSPLVTLSTERGVDSYQKHFARLHRRKGNVQYTRIQGDSAYISESSGKAG